MNRVASLKIGIILTRGMWHWFVAAQVMLGPRRAMPGALDHDLSLGDGLVHVVAVVGLAPVGSPCVFGRRELWSPTFAHLALLEAYAG